MAALFDPPLWQQRISKIVALLSQRSDHYAKVIDAGCGEGALLARLSLMANTEHLIGVDIDAVSLERAHSTLKPQKLDFENLRETKLEVTLLQGSLDALDMRLCGSDAIVCAEVIEHMFPEAFAAFPRVMLGVYSPAILIVTTPNAEFNVNFPQLMYGTPDSVFRHDDHKFEWTRSEFQSWAGHAASEFGYKVTFTGVGVLKSSPFRDVGFCTQIAVFRRKENNISENARNLYPAVNISHILHASVVYPCFEEPIYSTHAVLNELIRELQVLVYNQLCMKLLPFVTPSMSDSEFYDLIRAAWPKGATDKDDYNHSENRGGTQEFFVNIITNKVTSSSNNVFEVSIDSLWSLLRIRQVCKTKAYLVQCLESNEARSKFQIFFGEHHQSEIPEKLDLAELSEESKDVSLKYAGAFIRVLEKIPYLDRLEVAKETNIPNINNFDADSDAEDS